MQWPVAARFAARPPVPIGAHTAAEREAANPNLKWRSRQGGAEPMTLDIQAASAIESKTSGVTQAVAIEEDSAPAARPSRTSRAKLRDSILRVAAVEEDPFDDPFGEKKAKQEALTVGQPTETSPSDQTFEEVPPAEVEQAPPAETSELEPPAAESQPAPTDAPAPATDDESLSLPDADERPKTPEKPTCETEKEDCSKALGILKKKNIATIDISIAVTGLEGRDYPCECLLGDEQFEPRCWEETLFAWKASALCHKPLYFEEVGLERYGHSCNPVLQPLVSGAHFFGTLPLLPYKMSLNPPQECVYALGYYRPGNCAPYLIPAFPLDLDAALVEAGAIAGAILIIP